MPLKYQANLYKDQLCIATRGCFVKGNVKYSFRYNRDEGTSCCQVERENTAKRFRLGDKDLVNEIQKMKLVVKRIYKMLVKTFCLDCL